MGSDDELDFFYVYQSLLIIVGLCLPLTNFQFLKKIKSVKKKNHGLEIPLGLSVSGVKLEKSFAMCLFPCHCDLCFDLIYCRGTFCNIPLND